MDICKVLEESIGVNTGHIYRKLLFYKIRLRTSICILYALLVTSLGGNFTSQEENMEWSK